MQTEDLLSTDFSITDALAATHRGSLSRASQLLDSPFPRPVAGGSPEERAQALHERQEGISEAQRIALSLVEPSQYDIQVLIVLARSIIKTQEVPGFFLGLALVAKIVSEPWDGLINKEIPQEKQDRAFKKYSSFIEGFFDQLYDEIAYLSESSEEAVAFDVESLGADGERTWQSWNELLTHVEERLESRGLRRARWESLKARIEDLLPKAPPATGASAKVGEGSVGDGSVDLPSSETSEESMPSDGPEKASQETTGSIPPVSQERGARSATLRVSPGFWDLMERLRAFDWCLRHKEFEKASLIALDLEQRLNNFEVAGFFPELFAEYFVGTAAYSAELRASAGGQDDVRLQSLKRLYETDLVRFLQLGSDKIYEQGPFALGA